LGKINLGRVILGGVVAGIIIDIFEFFLNGIVLRTQWEAVNAAHNIPMWGQNEIIAYNLMGIAMGIVAVWTYAAIRPRFGAGVKTAVYAALLMWVTLYVLMDVSPLLTGMFPLSLVEMMVGVGLIEIIVATVAGAWLYKEADA